MMDLKIRAEGAQIKPSQDWLILELELTEQQIDQLLAKIGPERIQQWQDGIVR